MRQATKSSLYRNEVTTAAVEVVLACIARFPELRRRPTVASTWKPSVRQADRAVDWRSDDTAAVLRKIRSADGNPGLLDDVLGLPVYLYDAHPAEGLTGSTGDRPGARQRRHRPSDGRRRGLDRPSAAARRRAVVQAAGRVGSRRKAFGGAGDKGLRGYPL